MCDTCLGPQQLKAWAENLDEKVTLGKELNRLTS